MHVRALGLGMQVAEALDFGGRRQLFDCGGGPGTYGMLFCQRVPGLRAIVFDLPPVVAVAREIIAENGMANRVTTRAGDLRTDEFGQGNDAVLFSGVLHQFRPPVVQEAFHKAFRSMTPGGIVVVSDLLLNAEKSGPLFQTLFALNMLLTTSGGSGYSEAEHASFMENAGFVDVRVAHLPPPSVYTLLTARKPG